MSLNYFKQQSITYLFIIFLTWMPAIITMDNNSNSSYELQDLCPDLQRSILYQLANSPSGEREWVGKEMLNFFIKKIFPLPSLKNGHPIQSTDGGIYKTYLLPDNARLTNIASMGIPTSFGLIKTWNQNAMSLYITQNSGSLAGGISPIEYTPDNKYAFQISNTSTKFWNNQTGIDYSHVLLQKEHSQQITFSPDGCLFLTPSDNNTAKLWDVATGKQYGQDLQHSHNAANNNRVTSVAFSPDGKYVLTASTDGIAKLWDIETCVQYGPDLSHGKRITEVTFSLDGEYAITRSNQAVHSNKLWNMPNIHHVMKLLKGWRCDSGDIIGGLTFDQLELIHACSLVIGSDERIQLDQDQYKSFNDLPNEIKNTLINYVYQPAIKRPRTNDDTSMYPVTKKQRIE